MKKFFKNMSMIWRLPIDLATLGTRLAHVEEQVLEINAKTTFLMNHEPRVVRRRWHRMANNPRSPFYIHRKEE